MTSKMHILKKYKVNSIGEKHLVISGNTDDSLWKKAERLTDFSSPWEKQQVKSTVFMALWNVKHLFFNFTVFDSSVHIDKTDDTKNSINNSDRVELFFRIDTNLTPYYCLEIDPTPRVMDFIARPDKRFDFQWNWPKDDIEVKSFVGKEYFTVEGAISLASLKWFGLLKKGCIETGIYRAEYNEQQDGRYEPTWISWVDPKTKSPNFHTSSSFGMLQLIGCNNKKY